MDLNRLIPAVAKGDQTALREIYESYRTPFYYVARSIVKNEAAALSVAAEAFRRIRDSAYRFDEELNAEYCLLDVLFTLSYNKISSHDTEKENTEVPYLPEILKQEPEVFVKVFTDLGNNEIAMLVGKRKSTVSKLFAEKKDLLKSVKKTAESSCPDYWEKIISDAPTGAETVPHNVRSKTEKQAQKQKRNNYYKWILAVVLLVVFLSGAVLGIVKLIKNNYGSDVDKNAIGEDQPLQFNNNIAMTELNGEIYFRGSNNAFYKRHMESGKLIKLSDDHPKELLNDGTYIYYRNNNDGYMYRIDPDGRNRQRLCDTPGSAMALYKGFLYFSTKGGIYRIPASGGSFKTAELVLDTSNDANLFCVDLALDADGNVFFASGIGKGIHHVTEYEGAPSVDGIFAEEAYTIQIDGDKLYFDYKEVSGKIILYSFDLTAYFSEHGEKRIQPVVVSDSEGAQITLATGAFYVKNGCIYYTGVSNGKSVLYLLDETKKQSQIMEIKTDSVTANKNLSITDLYVTEEWVYCYCSDGKSNGKRLFFAGDLNKNETVTIYES